MGQKQQIHEIKHETDPCPVASRAPNAFLSDVCELSAALDCIQPSYRRSKHYMFQTPQQKQINVWRVRSTLPLLKHGHSVAIKLFEQRPKHQTYTYFTCAHRKTPLSIGSTQKLASVLCYHLQSYLPSADCT